MRLRPSIADEVEDRWSAALASGKHPLNMGLMFRSDRSDVVSVAFAISDRPTIGSFLGPRFLGLRPRLLWGTPLALGWHGPVALAVGS